MLAPMTACHICGCPRTEALHQMSAPFRLVSSDVRPVSGSAEFAFCSSCLTVQKAVTPAWRAMVEQIYATYDINHQSHGAEPTIFDSAKGNGPRSLMLLRNFLDVVSLPAKGRLLDIGCSNGNLLKSFHVLHPGWRLSGSELVDTWRETVLALPGVEAFYSGLDASYQGVFDVISLSHVLEHVPDPISFLKGISNYLAVGGRILLASPDLKQNPIDLVIADHCTHFDEQGLRYVADGAGLGVELLSASMLPKELVAILSPHRVGKAARAETGDAGTGTTSSRDRCLFYFALLEEVRKAARSGADEKRPFGVMGSSIAACWTMLELGGSVDFFVDEDAHRVGQKLSGLQILAPSQVPDGALVFIPMSVPVAQRIMQRWKHLPIDFRFVSSNQPLSDATLQHGLLR